MDFSFTAEQQMLRNSLQSFLQSHYPFDRRLAAVRSEEGWRRETWSALANQLGLLGIGTDERLGGSDGGPVENMIVMQELGRALVVEPYLETVVIGAPALAWGGGRFAEQLLNSLVSGDAVVAFAWAEPSMRHDIRKIAATATRDGSGWRLQGSKVAVVAAPWADYLLVPARTSGVRGDRDGLSLFVVDKTAQGLTEHPYPTIDGRRASDLEFAGVAVGAEALLGEEGRAADTIEALMDRAIAAISAEAVGAMQQMHADTLAYVKQRRQFGRPLSEFQVLQHRLVDMYLHTELALAAASRAALALDADPVTRARAASAAKVTIANACRFVGQNAIQLHGGIGMTDELSVSHYFRRTTVIESEFGTRDHHLTRHAEAAGLVQRPITSTI